MELNTQSSKLTLVGKNPNFKGIKTHRGILYRIHYDMNVNKHLKISVKLINRIVLGFFNSNGIARFFYAANIFYVKGIGTFKPTREFKAPTVKRKILSTRRKKDTVNRYERNKRKRLKEEKRLFNENMIEYQNSLSNDSE